jgi:hypothetical protein
MTLQRLERDVRLDAVTSGIFVDRITYTCDTAGNRVVFVVYGTSAGLPTVTTRSFKLPSAEIIPFPGSRAAWFREKKRARA